MESLIKVNRLHADRGAASEPERTVERRAKVRFCRDFATAAPCTCDDCPSTSTRSMSKTTASPVNMLQTIPPKEESVNMVSGNWRREEKGWVRVRSIMDSGCGASVAPPGMCHTYPIEESEGSRRGQDFMSASENTMPHLGD